MHHLRAARLPYRPDPRHGDDWALLFQGEPPEPPAIEVDEPLGLAYRFPFGFCRSRTLMPDDDNPMPSVTLLPHTTADSLWQWIADRVIPSTAVRLTR